MDPGTVAVVGLCAFLILWYAVAHVYNRHHGRQLFRWLERGLPVLGSEWDAGWIGSSASGARVNITRARTPFRRLEITLLLARREVPLLWLFDHLRGRRDRLIIKATLRSPRRGEVEVGLFRRMDPLRRDPSWAWEEGPHRLAIAYREAGAPQQVAGLRPWLECYGAHVGRFSWQKRDPHVQLQMNIPSSAEAVMADLRRAVGEATHVNK
jgi:hypothetical protein